MLDSRSGSSRSRCACRPISKASAGSCLPGGESTTMRQLIDRWALRQPLLDFAATGAPLFGTCAGMIILSKEIADGDDAGPAAARRDRAAERLRAAARLVRGRAATSRSWATSPSAACSSAPRSSSASGPASTCSRSSTTAGSWRSARRNIVATAFHPELAGEPRFHRLIATMAAEHDDPARAPAAAAIRPAAPACRGDTLATE